MLRRFLGAGIHPAHFRRDPAAALQTWAFSGTARFFCGKMFSKFTEKSWQQSARFSESDRTCGRKQARCQ
jgi:hypothetical protein